MPPPPPPGRRGQATRGLRPIAIVLLVMLSYVAANNDGLHDEGNVDDGEELAVEEEDFVQADDGRAVDGEGDQEDLRDKDEDDMWSDEEFEEFEELYLNATADELEVLSGVADFLGDLQQLLGDADHQKERERAERILADAWVPVQRLADATAAQAAFNGDMNTAHCVLEETRRVREAMNSLRGGIDDCYAKAVSEWATEASAAKSLHLGADEEESDEAEEVVAEADRFLSLGLAILRASPFIDAGEAVDALSAGAHAPSLSAHAEMLVRRGRRRRARLAACVDLKLEQAYKSADGARDAIAGCVVLGALARSKAHEEL